MKTEGLVQARARDIAGKAWWGVAVTSLVALISVSSIRPEIWTNFQEHGWGFIFPLIGALGLAGMIYYNRRSQDSKAFFSSTAFIAGMLASTAFGQFPNVLHASTDPKYSLTVYNTITHEYGLGVGLVWWTIGIIIALGYFTYLFYSFRGKVRLSADGY
jgi:cytochrome d ubiquinol oxidase subunit II